LSYSFAAGALTTFLCFAGMFPLLSAILPTPAIVPVLLYIGLVIGSQAFRVVPKAYYPAVVLAMVPNLAAWAVGYVQDALSAAGTTAAHVGNTALSSAGIVYDGLNTLGEGAILAGMVLGAIGVFLIDRRFLRAAAFCGFGACLSIVGLIHGAKVHVFTDWKTALGYALAGLTCVAFYLLRVPVRTPDPNDLVDVQTAREAGYRFDGPVTDGAARPDGAPVPAAVEEEISPA
jgi:AGZA family xanthine/uracil permease-like MFS transporter